jgi:hypothetical protein
MRDRLTAMGFLKDGGLRPEGEEARAYLESLEDVRADLRQCYVIIVLIYRPRCQ